MSASKTEMAKPLACCLGGNLIRLQFYDRLDTSSAVYERYFAAQMIANSTAESTGGIERSGLTQELYSKEVLVARVIVEAMKGDDCAPPSC